MNDNLRKLRDYLRSTIIPDWNYSEYPHRMFHKIFPEYFRWNPSWETCGLLQDTPAHLSQADLTAELFGLTPSQYAASFLSLPNETTQQQFIEELNKYDNEKANS